MQDPENEPGDPKGPKWPEWLRKLWHDPVWSKVISTIIISVAGLLYWAVIHEEPKAADKSFTVDELNNRNLTAGRCGKPQDVERLYAIAHELRIKTQQDAEFSGIVVEAACANDERLALEVLTAIDDKSLRDAASRRVIDKYLRDKKFDDANRWVKQLSNAQDKDWWIRKILESKRNDG